MKTRDRHTKLLALVAVFPLKVNALVEMLGVSDVTIYRDIDYLCSRNKVSVVRGSDGMTVAAL